jgi:flagellar motor switch protein FliM
MLMDYEMTDRIAGGDGILNFTKKSNNNQQIDQSVLNSIGNSAMNTSYLNAIGNSAMNTSYLNAIGNSLNNR